MTKKTQRSKDTKAREPQDDYETKLAEFEYAIWHLGAAFSRWRRDCLSSVSDINLSSSEASVLHAVHTNTSAKGVMEISRMLHRDDLPNIQYGLKKLWQLGLIQKQGSSRKNMTYTVTEAGNEIVEAYLTRRREVLLRLFRQVAPSSDDLADVIVQLHVMVGIYDQSSDLTANRLV